MNSKYTKIIGLKPSPFRWVKYIIGSICISLGLVITVNPKSDFVDYSAIILYGIVLLIDASMSAVPTWILKNPIKTHERLYQVDDKYISAASDEEAQLWANLSEIDKEPIYKGDVYHFEK